MSTRHIVRLFALLSAVALFSLAAPSQEAATSSRKTIVKGPVPATQVRMSWQDFISGPDGAKRLASLQKAITKMKSLDSSPKTSADYRRSWEYWANIHGYYGSSSPDGTVEEQIQYLKDNGMGSYVSFYTGITDQTPPDSIATTVWATCQHSSGPGPQQANFFGWHRMYLYYFERVLRWASGDNTLRLPYWDYTNPANLALPTDFRGTSSTLYDAKRNSSINSGSSTLNSNSTNVNTLLPIANYLSYEYQIEEGVHGYVHCTVGPTCPVAHMGDVPVAGNDPIFYSHHANIDRLWACWQKLHKTPAGAWQNQQFSFVDETGALKTGPVKNFLNSTALGYTYENDSSCARPGRALLNIRVAALEVAPQTPGGPVETNTMLGSTKGISIKNPQTSIDVAVPKAMLEKATSRLETAEAVELVLRDVTADSHPGVLFDVYLARKDDPSKREHVGTISWFGAFRKHQGQRMAPHKTLRYDVTSAVSALGGPSVAGAGLTVVIEATNGTTPADASKADEERKKANDAFRAGANLRIGSVELRAAAAPQEKPPTKKK